MSNNDGLQLRLFDDSNEDDPRKCSLSEVWQAHLRDRMVEAERKPDTLKEYGLSLNLWELATDRVPVESIDDGTGTKFMNWLKRRKWRGKLIGSNTRRKHAVHLQNVLDRLLPKHKRKNPWGLGLLTEVPLLAKPKLVLRDVDAQSCTRSELRKILQACVTTFPGARGQMWRDIHELCFYSLMRLDALWHAEGRWLVDDAMSKKYGGRWISVPAEFSKEGNPYRCFVAASAMPLLDRLDSKMGRWFAEICRDRNWFFECRRKIWDAAKVKRYEKPFHAIRKLGGTEIGMRNAFAAKLQLGHITNDVALNHYTSRRVQARHVSRRKPLFKPEGGSP